MRRLLLAALCVLAFPAFAQQSGTVTFDPPATGGAPAGFRLYRDNVLVGPVTSGQLVAGLFPTNTGSWVFSVETHNAACGASGLPACPRVNRTVTLGPPPLQPPGPVISVTVDAPCARATPPTCTVTVVSP